MKIRISNLKSQIPAAVLLIIFVFVNIFPDIRGDGTYYAAGRLLLAGRFGPQVYDDRWMRDWIEEATQGRVSDIFTPNPPTAALIALPVARLPPDAARRLWAALNAMVLVAVILILGHSLATPLPLADYFWSLAALAFSLFATPIHEVFRLGQAYIVLLALLAAAWLDLRRNRPPLTGLSLALALCLKLSGTPIWILLAARREWRALAWAAGFALAIVALTLPLVGVETWRVYLMRVLPSAAASPTVAVTAYQSLAGFWAHLFRFDAMWNPAPLADRPTLATCLTLLSTISVIGLTLYVTRHSSLVTAFPAMAMASVFLVPYAEQHHYALAALPIWIAISHRPSRIPPPVARSSTARIALVIAAVLIALPLPYKSALLSTGGWALFAYPRLYGGLLLWAALLYFAHEESRP